MKNMECFINHCKNRISQLNRMKAVLDFFIDNLVPLESDGWTFDISSESTEEEEVSVLVRRDDQNFLMVFLILPDGLKMTQRFLHGSADKTDVIKSFQMFHELFDKFGLISYQDIP